ncbi:MAG: TlpA family protein disulfide reductase [Clostridia bacterium]|nr:TlpA family protein disulfide reductase [Clostridia bacterium]
MSKLKKIILAILISCFAACAGIGIAACTGANFRMPQGYDPNGSFNGRYTIAVQSAGGMKLNGIKVDAKKGNTVVVSGISKDGEINFNLEPDVYQLEVDTATLPAGYYLEDTTYYTSPVKGDVTIKISSKVITSAATSNTVYTVGDVMYDFSYTDALGGNKHTLTELLDEKIGGYKAVMLNFFYIGCAPCKMEFPAIEEAYKAYDDKIAIVALSYRDANPNIVNYAEGLDPNPTFHMGYDAAGLTNKFGVDGWPTTVIVDRYGLVANIHRTSEFSATYWRNLFHDYTRDDYGQEDIIIDDDPNTTPTEYAKPAANLIMPSSEAIDEAITGKVMDGASINRYYAEEGNDKDNSWPWLISGADGDKFLVASNAETDYSFSTLYADITLTAGSAISYEYYVTTETGGDFLYVLVDGKIVSGGDHSGDSEGWKEHLAAYVADSDETVTLAFMYFKNLVRSVDNEKAWIKNINIRPVTEIMDVVDQRTSAVNNLIYEAGKNYAITNSTHTLGGYNLSISKHDDDGYYYITKDGTTALLLADILNAGYWAKTHLGASTFVDPEGNHRPTSVYQLSFWKLANYKEATNEIPLAFDYLTDDQTKNFIQDYYLQGFSDNGLLPVTDKLVAILNQFIDAMYEKYSDSFVDGDRKYDGQWLEFCYYYKHYGSRADHICYEEIDPVKGLIYDNAIEIEEGKTEVNVTKILNLSDGGGLKYKLVPEHSGIYLFRSEIKSGSGTDPQLYVFDKDFKLVVEADNDMRRGGDIYSDSHDNYFAYAWLKEGETYYVHGAINPAGETGTFNMYIEYQNVDSIEYMRYASTGDGVFTYTTEPPVRNYYLAVNVALNQQNNIYYHYTNGKFGSKIYIDFLHSNYFDRNGHSLEEIVNNNYFNFKKNGGADYTPMMKTYLATATNKDKNDPMYGLVEADKTLVNILSFACTLALEEPASSGAWEMFAVYMETVSRPANA